ncbi:uncharacterized protein LOC134822824 [Bolinopsis microptera]|uniref:uncharacterized protein LOC134822824 n=1 Tax=Bolinopsis microptera TaxID=2820187 RepID=UPI00307933B8
MIHWGSSIPCTLYIDSRKECDLNLPDSASWQQITSEVTQKFKLTPGNWFYTLSDLGSSEEVASEEHFRTIKETCANTRQLLQLNVTTGPGVANAGVPVVVDETSPKFQTAVELAVQNYLSKHGPELIRDLAHRSKLCCCNKTQRRSGCSSESGGVNSHLQVVQGDMVLDNCDAMFIGDQHSSQVSQVSSSLPLYSSFLTISTNQEPAPDNQSQDRGSRKSNREEDVDNQVCSSKRAKAIPPDKEYILGPCKNSIVTVTPGTEVEVVWSLVVKQGVESCWELVDEGGTIHPVGGAGVGKWTSSTDNIQEFSVKFVAPSAEGMYESKWTLLQDSIGREAITLCSMKVQINTDKKGGSLACHGNIPADISVPKLLNSNKVFCMSSEEMPSSSGD